MQKTINTRFLIRRDTYANWTQSLLTFKQGEMAYDLTNNILYLCSADNQTFSQLSPINKDINFDQLSNSAQSVLNSLIEGLHKDDWYTGVILPSDDPERPDVIDILNNTGSLAPFTADQLSENKNVGLLLYYSGSFNDLPDDPWLITRNGATDTPHIPMVTPGSIKKTGDLYTDLRTGLTKNDVSAEYIIELEEDTPGEYITIFVLRGMYTHVGAFPPMFMIDTFDYSRFAKQEDLYRAQMLTATLLYHDLNDFYIAGIDSEYSQITFHNGSRVGVYLSIPYQMDMTGADALYLTNANVEDTQSGLVCLTASFGTDQGSIQTILEQCLYQPPNSSTQENGLLFFLGTVGLYNGNYVLLVDSVNSFGVAQEVNSLIGNLYIGKPNDSSFGSNFINYSNGDIIDSGYSAASFDTAGAAAATVTNIAAGTAADNGKVRLQVTKGGTTSNVDLTVKGLATVATTGSYNDLSNKPTIPSAPGTLNTNNNQELTVQSSESLSGSINLHRVAKTGNASKVNDLQILDQTYAYADSITTTIGCVGAIVNTGLTEQEIFNLAPTSSMYGKLYLASDTNEYWRRKDTQTGAGSTHWRNDTTAVNNSLALSNQLTTEDAIYIRVNLNNKYYSKLVKFFVAVGYDNISGSTSITAFCRQQNQFEITSCSYNGNNLIGIYQPTANTDVYVFKFAKFRSSYGADSNYNVSPLIYYNQYSGTPTIEFIGVNHADYNTVKAYGYISVPAYGIKGTNIQDNLIPISTNAYDLGTSSIKWRNLNLAGTVNTANVTASGTVTAATIKKTGGTSSQFLKADGSVDSKSYITAADIPTIPTVNNGTLTIKKNGTSVATFTANQAGNSEADITVPTKTSDLTNDSGFITDAGVTSVSLASGTNNGTLKLTVNGSATDNIAVKGLGTAAYKNTGSSAGNIPVLDSNGYLDETIIPAVAITDTFTASSQAAMLALIAEKGDVCIRTDLNKTYILSTNSPSTLADWKELLTPTDAVSSVNGKTGVVQLTANDVGALSDDTVIPVYSIFTSTTDGLVPAASNTNKTTAETSVGNYYLCTDGKYRQLPANAFLNDNTNYYHTSGTWNGLTYTATANGGAGALAFTIPTGTTATTVALGNHTHALPTALNSSVTKGTTTKPIYVSSGTISECSTYAGGTAVTLNGTSKAASTASFYAPSSGGGTNAVLFGGGVNAAPVWETDIIIDGGNASSFT